MSDLEYKRLPELELDFKIIQRHQMREEGIRPEWRPVIPPFRCGLRSYLLEQSGVFVMMFNPENVDVLKCVRSLHHVVMPLECWTLEHDNVVDVRLVEI